MLSLKPQVRLLVFVAMAVMFFWQTIVAFGKFFQARVGRSVSIELDADLVWPEITTCIQIFGMFGKQANFSFSDMMSLVAKREDFVKEAQLVSAKNLSVLLNYSDPAALQSHGLTASQLWRRSFSVAKAGLGDVIYVCFVFNPSVKAVRNTAIVLDLNLTGFDRSVVQRVHDPGQLVILGIEGDLGDVDIKPNRLFTDRHLGYLLSWSRMSMLNSEANPCSPGNDMSMERCVDDYVQAMIGCTLSWKGDNRGGRVCNTAEDLDRFARATLELMQSSRREAVRLTGCRSNCAYNRYSVSLVNNLTTLSPKGYSQMTVILKQQDLTVEQEDLIYDGNSLVADVGGYLGLLLGASAMTFFDASVALAEALFGRYVKKEQTTSEHKSNKLDAVLKDTFK